MGLDVLIKHAQHTGSSVMIASSPLPIPRWTNSRAAYLPKHDILIHYLYVSKVQLLNNAFSKLSLRKLQLPRSAQMDIHTLLSNKYWRRAMQM